MTTTKFDAAFPNLKARDVALAAVSANRILLQFLIQAGVNQEKIEDAFRAKAGELISQQFEDNAANLLRMMGGVIGSKGDE